MLHTDRTPLQPCARGRARCSAGGRVEPVQAGYTREGEGRVGIGILVFSFFLLRVSVVLAIGRVASGAVRLCMTVAAPASAQIVCAGGTDSA
jgi:hypothetical protein